MQALFSSLNKKREMVGAWLWVFCIEYFLTQAWVASQWSIDFDIRKHAISDLGAVTCGTFGDRMVCSPQHTVMNAGFIVLGLLMAGGSYFLWQHFKQARLGFILIAMSGLGGIIVGIFPEDTVEVMHIAGASLSFITGGLGMIVCGLKLDIPRWLRYVSIFLGVFSLISLIALSLGFYQTLGFGTVERFVSYPITLWLMTFGVSRAIAKSRRSL
ncbi:DUF998 domain-containing protein [Microbacteriaceae bacterium]|nr:DUF998 domain-containing protein [Candidatus Saccharibacteria bacterium]